MIIGGEGRWEELRHCTLIVSRYGIGEDLTGRNCRCRFDTDARMVAIFRPFVMWQIL